MPTEHLPPSHGRLDHSSAELTSSITRATWLSQIFFGFFSSVYQTDKFHRLKHTERERDDRAIVCFIIGKRQRAPNFCVESTDTHPDHCHGSRLARKKIPPHHSATRRRRLLPSQTEMRMIELIIFESNHCGSFSKNFRSNLSDC